MSKRNIYIYAIFILAILFLICEVDICEADFRENLLPLAQAGYRRISPLNTSSPKPDIIQDREFINRNQTDTQQQPKLSEEPMEEEMAKETLTHVGSEPSKIYYQISVNDVLYISVWRVKDLSLEFIVGPDGKISFPLIGDIQASGRTLADVDAEITEKLKEYVVNPQVSVMVRKFAGDKLTVIGEVRSPGIYKFVGRTNILDVIALAGGFNDRAKSASIVIVRESDNPEQESIFLNVPIKSILKGDLSKNIEVKPNDIVYISRTFVSNIKEFYDNWIVPTLQTAIDLETWRSLKKTRVK